MVTSLKNLGVHPEYPQLLILDISLATSLFESSRLSRGIKYEHDSFLPPLFVFTYLQLE